MKVQVSKGEGYVKIGVDLKHINKILAIKTKQVKPKENLQNLDLKDDVRIKIINSSNARMRSFNNITIIED